jgi:hypothetical protein
LEQNLDKINWNNLSRNPNATYLLEHNTNKIDWSYLSLYSDRISLLESNMNKINWQTICANPIIFTYDYDKIKRNSIGYLIMEQLVAKVFHPERLMRICKTYNIRFDQLMEMY